MSKALQVREMIAQAKALGSDAVSLIPAVMALGMKRQLARTYILGNWDRVEAAVVVEQKPSKPAKTLSMSRDAIRKREARAAKRATAAASVVAEAI
jgi:hypothetical protein